MPLIDHRALLLWNIFTDFVLNSVTFSVMDNLAFGHSVGDTLLLGHGLALALIPGGTGLGSLRGTGFFMESFECALPNGFHYSGAEGSTFLDAVYVENLSTYFVLDALQVFMSTFLTVLSSTVFLWCFPFLYCRML